MALAAMAACGCARTLRVTCDAVINTGFQPNGSPLNVDVVSVFPHDLRGKHAEVNEFLKPGSGITADVWFARKPTRESRRNDEDTSHFQIDRAQILSFTDKKKEDVYGRYLGGQILGRKYWSPGKNNILVSDVPAKDIFDDHSVIYVFCRFTDEKGNVLPTQPATFAPVGSFESQLAVHVGGGAVTGITKKRRER